MVCAAGRVEGPAKIATSPSFAGDETLVLLPQLDRQRCNFPDRIDPDRRTTGQSSTSAGVPDRQCAPAAVRLTANLIFARSTARRRHDRITGIFICGRCAPQQHCVLSLQTMDGGSIDCNPSKPSLAG
jgi:hypothetical protein